MQEEGDNPTPDLPRFLDWVWVPTPAGHGSGQANVGDEFHLFPPLVRGELLARIVRLLNGDSRRGDSTQVNGHLTAMMLTVGKVRYWIVYTVVDGRCVGLLCCTTFRRHLDQRQIDEATQRSNRTV